jgi:hypothetical protein
MMVSKEDVYNGIDLLVEAASRLPSKDETEYMTVEELARQLNRLDELEESYKILKDELKKVGK